MNGKRKSPKITVDELKQIVIDKEETIWSVEEVAKMFNVSTQAIRKRISRGLIPAHKQGRMWFILKSEYIRNIRENRSISK